MQVIPITTTSVRIVWSPLGEEAWNGDQNTGGYRIDYRQISDFPTPVLLQGAPLFLTSLHLVLLGLTVLILFFF